MERTVGAPGVCPDSRDKIALVVAPGIDFHWYRLDTSGFWTHKPGATQATNVDNSGNPITNPETAALGSLPREIAVYQQRVQTRDGSSRRVLTDNGAIETFLAGEAERSKALDTRALEILHTGRVARGNSP